MPSRTLRDPSLDEFYRTTPGPAVAFLDESMRTPDGDEIPFYEMTAVLLPKDNLDRVRDDLVDIPGHQYWHTTDEYTNGRADDILTMSNHVATESDWNIVSVATPITGDPDNIARARRACLSSLTREITRGTGPNAVRAIVADNNRDPHLNNADSATVNQLRSNGTIDRHVGFRHARMGDEPLLWAADAAAWSIRRNIAVNDGRFVQPYVDEGKLSVLEAATGKPLDMKQPQAAAATLGAQQHRLNERAPAVVSTPSLPADRDTSQVIRDLARQARDTRQSARIQNLRQRQQSTGNVPDQAAHQHGPHRHGPQR